MEKPGSPNNRYQVALLRKEYLLLFLDDVKAPGRRLRLTLMGMLPLNWPITLAV